MPLQLECEALKLEIKIFDSRLPEGQQELSSSEDMSGATNDRRTKTANCYPKGNYTLFAAEAQDEQASSAYRGRDLYGLKFSTD